MSWLIVIFDYILNKNGSLRGPTNLKVIRLDEEFGPILQVHAMSLVNSVIIGVLHSIHDPMRARQSTRSITYHQGTRSARDYLMAKIS